MQKYFRVFFVVLLAHTLKFNWILSPVSGTALELDKDSKATDRLVVNHLFSDMEGYKAYVYKLDDNKYVNVTKVYFGERLLKVDGSNMKCDSVHYVKVFWYGDVAPFMVKFKYYDWVWVSYRLHFKLTNKLEWTKVFVATIDDTSEEGYRKLFKKRMDSFVSEVGEENLKKFKAFSYSAKNKTEVTAGPTEEEKKDKKKYVLMVVVVVVFVVVASLVVFLVKFCLK